MVRKWCVETSPDSGWGLQKLEEGWNAQSPNLAPALLAQPCPVYLPELGFNSIQLLQRLGPPHPSQLGPRSFRLALTNPPSFGGSK